MAQTATDDPSTRAAQSQARLGLIYGISAYLAWGFAPLYFKLVAHVSPLLVLCHRIVWSVALLVVLVAWKRQGRQLIGVLKRKRAVAVLLLSTLLVASNWYQFIYAIGHDRVMEASLGYFINPLFSVFLGVVFLRERLRLGQTIALLLAMIAVGYLGIRGGQIPWLGLGLATSFGFYGLVRKTLAVEPLVGLMVETTLLLPAALIWLLWTGHQAVPRPIDWLWLPMAGLVTAVPLLWFTNATKRLRLATIGFLQYIAPTGQFLLAAWCFGEPLDQERLQSFVLIWIALVVYTLDSWRSRPQSE
jgi:chloramphenicol-sensitive protein RarD